MKLGIKLHTEPVSNPANTDYLKRRGVETVNSHYELEIKRLQGGGVEICGGTVTSYTFPDGNLEVLPSSRACVDIPPEMKKEVIKAIKIEES